jgi:hypothetical protein
MIHVLLKNSALGLEGVVLQKHRISCNLLHGRQSPWLAFVCAIGADTHIDLHPARHHHDLGFKLFHFSRVSVSLKGLSDAEDRIFWAERNTEKAVSHSRQPSILVPEMQGARNHRRACLTSPK